MQNLLTLFGVTVGALLALSIVLHLVPKLGRPGRALSEVLCRAPGIDLMLALYMLVPWTVGPVLLGWAGLGVAVLAQIVSLWVWIIAHELLHPGARKSPRIRTTMSGIVGVARNHAAVWVTSLAVPVFWLVRFAEIFVYPPLTWLVGLPRYRAAEWVSVSRHKFEGLVGYDLIWCLYCDWMTGVWSLGSEMLRNVESFWCPIRFADPAKCANCSVDFPDVERGWVPADGDMNDVADLLQRAYTKGVNPWFGHPVRLTLEGREMEEAAKR